MGDARLDTSTWKKDFSFHSAGELLKLKALCIGPSYHCICGEMRDLLTKDDAEYRGWYWGKKQHSDSQFLNWINFDGHSHASRKNFYSSIKW